MVSVRALWRQFALQCRALVFAFKHGRRFVPLVTIPDEHAALDTFDTSSGQLLPVFLHPGSDIAPVYDTIAVRLRCYTGDIEWALLKFGAAGWRLVAVAPYGVVDEGKSRTVHVLYFERRVPT